MKKQANSISLKLKNVTYRVSEVSAIDSSKPVLRNAMRNEFKSVSVDWTNRFLNEDNTTWVNDGKTLPVAFGDNFSIEITYFRGITPFTYTQIIVNKTSFLNAAKDISQGIFIQSGVTDDWGMDVRYLGSILYVNFNVYEDDAALWVKFENLTTSVVLTKNQYTETVLDTSSVGSETNTPIIPTFVAGESYSEVVTSLLDNPLGISGLEIYSTNTEQILSAISFRHKYANGGESSSLSTPIISPYQYQNIVKYDYDLVMDGQTKVKVVMQGDSEALITFNYSSKVALETNKEGVTTDYIVTDAMYNQETEELEQAYLNFDGFASLKTKPNTGTSKLTTIILVGLIGLLLTTKR